MSYSRSYASKGYSEDMSRRTTSYGGGTVYAKSVEGLLKLGQIFCGLLAFALFASLPYNEEIYVQGHTAIFHCTLALIIIAWLITLGFYFFRFQSGADTKFNWTTGMLGQNILCFILMGIGGILLSINVNKFHMGRSLMHGGYQNQNSHNNQDNGDNNLGSCANLNLISPYCMQYQDVCQKFATECLQLAKGLQNNKYYHTAIVTVIFIFFATILYLVEAILILKKKGTDWLPGGDDEANDISFTPHDVNVSLNRNSWKKTRTNAKASDRAYLSGPRDNSTMKEQPLA